MTHNTDDAALTPRPAHHPQWSVAGGLTHRDPVLAAGTYRPAG